MKREIPVPWQMAKAASVPEAARMLGGISTRSVFRMLGDGRLRGVRLGRRVVVPLSEIERVLEAR